MKRGLTLILSVLIFLPMVSAFMSPATLTIVGASVGSLIWGIILAASLNVFVFVSEAKKHVKMIIVVFSVVLIVTLVVVSAGKFQTLKEVNDYAESSIEVEEWQDVMDYIGLNITENTSILRESINDEGRFFVSAVGKHIERIDLQDAIYSNEYRVFSIYDKKPVTAVNSTRTKFYKLMFEPENVELFENLTAQYNLSKEDKIIIFCENTYSSKTIALIFAFHGYDVWYSGLEDIDDENLLVSDFIVDDFSDNVFVDTLSRDRDDEYLYFLMKIGDMRILKDDRFDNFMEDRTKFIRIRDNVNIYYFKELDKRDLLGEIEEGDFENRKIICGNKAHCFLTKHYLNSINVTNVEEIYLME